MYLSQLPPDKEILFRGEIIYAAKKLKGGNHYNVNNIRFTKNCLLYLVSKKIWEIVPVKSEERIEL